jgi:2-polyprenyl-3-methyl-5-hydroxy-6-metoxy-1,4-benzoquinol methylase
MIKIHKHIYEYLEEINEGIINNIEINSSGKVNKVLDVGCGAGALAEAIGKKGYSVWGIESNIDACKTAKKRIDQVINCDLTNYSKIQKILRKEKFDIIVFSDVLEHIYDPYVVLASYLKFLNVGGKVIISVPNVAVWSNRFKVLFGLFNYSDTGLMDRTHIRFFTFRTTRLLVESAGCEVHKMDYTPYIVRAALPIIKLFLIQKDNDMVNLNRRVIIDSPLFRFYNKYIYPIEYAVGLLFKRFLAFRIIIIGKKVNTKGGTVK